MSDLFKPKRKFGRWIAIIIPLAIIVFILLIRFTSFQIPQSLTGDAPPSRVGGGVTPQGSAESQNNLDAVQKIIDGRSNERTHDE